MAKSSPQYLLRAADVRFAIVATRLLLLSTILSSLMILPRLLLRCWSLYAADPMHQLPRLLPQRPSRPGMAKWSLAAADTPTALLTTEEINTYMAVMCTRGYTGPICGACQPGFGHSGHACVKCPPRSVNSFIYFLVCCFMLLVPALQMVLHAKGVSKNKKLVAAARRGSGLRIAAARAPNPALLPKAGACCAGGSASFLPVLQPVHEVAPNSATIVCPSAMKAAEAAPTHVSPFVAEATAMAGGVVGSSMTMGKDAHAIELTHLQHCWSPAVTADGNDGGQSDVERFNEDQGGGGGYTAMLPRFCQPTAAEGAIAVSRDGSAATTAATNPSGMQIPQVGVFCG